MSNFDNASAVRLVVSIVVKERIRSPYSDYQKLLFSKVRDLHEHRGMTFKAIAETLDADGFLTVKGHRLTAELVFSTYNKGKVRAKTFSQKPIISLLDLAVL